MSVENIKEVSEKDFALGFKYAIQITNKIGFYLTEKYQDEILDAVLRKDDET